MPSAEELQEQSDSHCAQLQHVNFSDANAKSRYLLVSMLETPSLNSLAKLVSDIVSCTIIALAFLGETRWCATESRCHYVIPIYTSCKTELDMSCFLPFERSVAARDSAY